MTKTIVVKVKDIDVISISILKITHCVNSMCAFHVCMYVSECVTVCVCDSELVFQLGEDQMENSAVCQPLSSDDISVV